MVKVRFTEEGKILSLRIEGHAGYAEHGKDIVCASASILANTLAATVLEFDEVYDVDTLVDLTSGDTTIKCKCNNYATYIAVSNAYRYTKVGYALLAHNYPQYVEFITDVEV